MIEPAGIANEITVAVLGLIAVLLFFVFRSAEERRALVLLAVASYAVKAILVPLYFWLLVYDGSGGFAYSDSHGYHASAEEMALEISHNLPHQSIGWRYKDPGYNYVVALLYAAFGSSTLIARFFNVAVNTMTLLYVYRIGVIAFDSAVARTAARIFAFLPFTLLVTINHRKEAAAIFVATLLFYHALRIVTQRPGWMTSILTMAVWLVPVYFVRGGFVLPFLALFTVMLFMTQRSVVLGALLSVLVAFALVGTQVLLPESEELNVRANVSAIDDRLEATRWNVERTGGLLRYAKVTSPLDIWKAPIAAFLLVLMPFPPDIIIGADEPIYKVLLSWSHVAFIVIFPQLFLGLRELFRRESWKKRMPLFIYSAGFLLLIGALSVGVMRYRETVFPVVVVIAAAGFHVRQNFAWSASIYAGLTTFALFVYLNRYVI